MNDDKIINDTEVKYSIEEAALVCNKSIHTIRKILQERKIKSARVKVNGKSKIQIDFNELVNYYGIDGVNKKVLSRYQIVTKEVLSIKDSDSNSKKDEENSIMKFLEKKISDLEVDKKNLLQESESRRGEAERMQKLLENQQTLMLGLQQQMKGLIDNLKMDKSEKLNFEESIVEAEVSNTSETIIKHPKSNVYIKNHEVPANEVNVPNIQCKWWHIWK